MIVFGRRRLGLRLAEVDGVRYGLTDLEGFSGEPTVVWLGALVGGQHVRLGETWEQVNEADDEARARELIAEHHESLVAGSQRAAA